MWVKLVATATLLPMLVHSILGCCWHHAHDECDRPCEHSTAESHDGHRHAHDQSSGHNVPFVPAPCEHDDPCDDARCIDLAAQPVRNVLAFDRQSQLAELDSCCILPLNATLTATRSSQLSHEDPTSSQRRAFTQIWVV